MLNNAKWFIFYKRFTVETGVRLWSCLENHFDTWSTFHLSGVAKLKELVLASENMMPKSTGFESSLDIAPIQITSLIFPTISLCFPDTLLADLYPFHSFNKRKTETSILMIIEPAE